MKRNLFISLFLSILLLLSFSAWAVETRTKVKRGSANLIERTHENHRKRINLSQLDNPATFKLMKKMRRKEQAVVNKLNMFPLPKFKNITKEIYLGIEDIDEIFKSKAKTLNIPLKMRRSLASMAVVEEESPHNIGNWIQMPDGSVTYLLKITLDGAERIGIKFGLNQFYEDAFVLVYTMKNNKVLKLEGPITFTPRSDSNLVVPSIISDEIYIEIRNLPERIIDQTNQDPFIIKDIQYFAPDLYKYLLDERMDSLPQHNDTKIGITAELAATCSYTDVNCVPSVNSIKSGIVKLVIEFSTVTSVCTGFIINDNESSTDIPYILTAGHCVEDPFEVREVHFWYESSDCDLGDTHSWYQAISPYIDNLIYENGSTLDSADWGLLRFNLLDSLNNIPVFLEAKIEEQPFGDKVDQIHHPEGDKKKFSKGACECRVLAIINQLKYVSNLPSLKNKSNLISIYPV